MMNNDFLAAMDMGSNTLVTLVAVAAGESLAVAEEITDATQLGAGMKDGLLAQDAMDRTLAAMGRQLALLHGKYPGIRLTACATSAVCEARNGMDFMDRCAEECGFSQPPVIITGEEEASLTFKGASALFSDGRLFVNADPGGGSTELTLGVHGEKPLKACSVKAGCVRFRDAFNLGGICEPEDMKNAYNSAVGLFMPHAREFSSFEIDIFSISGGTAYAAASLLNKKNGQISRHDVKDLLDSLSPMPLETRAKVPGMPLGRASVVPAGLLILLALMDCFGAEQFLPNPGGLRLGMAMSLQNGELPVIAQCQL